MKGFPVHSNLGDRDILLALRQSSSFIQGGVSVLNRGSIKTEGLRSLIIIYDIVRLPVSLRWWIAFAHIMMIFLVAFMIKLVILLNLQQNLLVIFRKIM